jgi:hypothetical protein
MTNVPEVFICRNGKEVPTASEDAVQVLCSRISDSEARQEAVVGFDRLR